MGISAWKSALLCSSIATMSLGLGSLDAGAQQVTYYDFNSPQANPSQYSYTCSPASLSGTLFCLNDATGNNNNPSFINDFYPASIDPTGGSGSNQFAVQMTPAVASQAASLWFSVPQKVANGFSVWFAFKATPTGQSYATADGIAFVLQNAQGPAVAPNGGYDAAGGCQEQGAGYTVVGSAGGCMGYGGIDNSLALEFDTYQNGYDPVDIPGSLNDNHIALQNCGAGQTNSPAHYNAGGQVSSCLVSLGSAGGPVSTLVSNPQSSTPGMGTVALADGNVHQVVVIYSGPDEATPNLLQVYIDPPFVEGTHTPAANAVPVFSGTYDVAKAINLINSGTANDSAYVGFTSATGSAFEQHELMAWTFTPHTTVTQQQPLNPPGTTTVFPFGTHDYTVNFPPGGASTSGISMVVTANTLAPALFSSLIAPTTFSGSQCQVYDDTGGNCIVYSVSCVVTQTGAPVQCPSTADPTKFATITSSYNNSIQPISPGFLQGDPFYTQIASISGDGSTATVTCSGECSVTPGQTVTIFGAQPAGFNGTVTVATADPSVPNVFTFATTASGSATTGGYLTSGNVQNIFVSYSPQTLDATSTGRPPSFSDFVVTSVTTAPSQTQLTAATTPTQGLPDVLTATVTTTSSQVPGPGKMPVGTYPAIAPSTVSFIVGSGANATTICTAPVTAVTATSGTATCTYTPTSTGPVTVTAQYSDAYHVTSSGSLALNVAPPYDTAIQMMFGSTVFTYPRTTQVNVCVAPATAAPATGTISLKDGTTLLNTLTLGAGGCASWTIAPVLSAGNHPITAYYSGDIHNPAGYSMPIVLTVNPAVVFMVPVCGPNQLAYGISYGCAVGLAYDIGLVKGTMNYSLDGAASVNVPVNLGVALFSVNKPALGQHSLVLNFPAQTNYQAAGPFSLSFTVTPAPVKVALTSSTRSAKTGTPVSFTASVTSSSAGAPASGAVSFYVGTALLATVPVNSSGVATWATAALPLGTDTITATYSGAPDYGSSSAAVNVTITR